MHPSSYEYAAATMGRATGPSDLTRFGAENLRIRALLMARLREMMTSRRLTQMQAARWFHVSQSRVSHLARNRMNRFTTDTLINMLAHAGVRLRVGFENE
jgi:predicted XRE-type DNA-binding protein